MDWLNIKVVSEFKRHSPPGNDEDILLPFNSRVLSAVNINKLDGREPTNRFDFIDRVYKFVKLPNSGGTVEVNLLLESVNDVSLDNFPKNDGRAVLNELPLNVRWVSEVNEPKVDGMIPVILLLLRYKDNNLDIPLISDGNEPTNEIALRCR